MVLKVGPALDLRLDVGKLLRDVVLVDLGFGRIVVSEKEAPNNYVSDSGIKWIRR